MVISAWLIKVVIHDVNTPVGREHAYSMVSTHNLAVDLIFKAVLEVRK